MQCITVSAAGRSPLHERQGSHEQSQELTSFREFNRIFGLVVAIAA